MPKSLDYWRGYFSGANSEICDIIENAVIVAALDHPEELKLKRDHIAELLFTCQLTKCFRCEKVELSGSKDGAAGGTLVEGEKFKSSGELEEGEKRGKEKKVDDGHAPIVSYEDAAELNDAIEKASQLIEEVVRIKDILDNPEASESMLLDSLRRLQLMDISVEILKATEIGKSVRSHKKHGSKTIRDLVQTLVDEWIFLLDSYVKATAAITENTSPDSMPEEGLPSPPLDEGAFLTHSVELSDEFFDDIDENGNLKINLDINNNRGSGRRPSLKDGNVPTHKQQQLRNALIAPPQENKVQQTMKEETVMKKKAAVVNTNKPSSASTRPITTRAEQKFNNETKSQLERDERGVQKKPFAHHDDARSKHREQQSANGAIRRKLLPPPKEKLRSSEDLKTEATKRKLQERYQEAGNAKKQRTNHVTPLNDITKHGAGRNQMMKPGHSNYNRH